VLFWTAADLGVKLSAFKVYSTDTELIRRGKTPVEATSSKKVTIKS
jgi:hypothetical protein